MSIIHDVFQPIYGKPCWQVQQLGSVLYLEFGEPRLEIWEPRRASKGASEKVRKLFARRQIYVRGEWSFHTWFSDWRILLHGKDCANQDSSRRFINAAIEELDGQVLVRVTVKRDLCLRLKFDLGGMLEIIPDLKTDGMSRDQWILFEPSGYFFAMRGDGYCCHMPADTRPAEQAWLPLKARS